jgi:hypothetical protein
LFWGEHAVQSGVWESLVAIGILGLGGLAVLAWKRPSNLPVLEREAWAWLLICTGFYSAVMCYLGVRVTISFGTRMFQPLLPLYLCMFALGLHWLVRSRPGAGWKLFLGLFVMGTVGSNARDLGMPMPRELHRVFERLYDDRLNSGQSLRQWVEAAIPADEVILAGDGQATGYLLKRPTVSLLEAHYTAAHWDCATVLETMQRFQARYVFLYQPSVVEAVRLAEESEFVRASLAGRPPCGFQIAAQTGDITVVTRPAVSSVP